MYSKGIFKEALYDNIMYAYDTIVIADSWDRLQRAIDIFTSKNQQLKNKTERSSSLYPWLQDRACKSFQ